MTTTGPSDYRRRVRSSLRRALLAVLLLAGCRPAPVQQTVVEMWAMGREGELVQQLLRDFPHREPGIRVKVQQVPWSAAHEKLLTAFVGGSTPDVVQVGTTWIPELVALGALEPLDARLAASTRLPADDFFAGIADTNVIDGVTYGVPWYVDTRLWFYRHDVFATAGIAEMPRTWDAWDTAMQQVAAQVGDGRFALLLPLAEWQPLVILALQYGATLLRDDDRYGDFRSPPFRAAFARYLALFRNGLAPATGAAQIANLYQDFADGFFASFLSGPWNIEALNRRLPPAARGTWATAPLPSVDAVWPGVSLAGGASLSVLRTSPRQEAAWRVIEYLCEPERQLAFYRLGGDLPSRRSAWAAGALASNPPTAAFWQQLQRVRSTPKVPEWERVAGKITQYAEAAVRGDLDPETALVRLDADVDAILEKRRWLMRRAAEMGP